MKFILCCYIFTVSLSCQHASNSAYTQPSSSLKTIIVDSILKDTILQHIQFASGRYFSQFNTTMKFHWFCNDRLVDSIVQSDFHMISWYTIRKDTIDLVAHVGEFEATALLVRFISGKPTVFYYKASHEGQKYFRLNKRAPYKNDIEVSPKSYRLMLSTIPDRVRKPTVYGFIEMESSDYYSKRDSIEDRYRVDMKFYFRSQYIKYPYTD